METILTATSLKAARESLNISQANAAMEIGLNRSYLSQFESGQRLLKDETRQNLLDYYVSQGLEDSLIPEVPVENLLDTGDIRIVDNFQVPIEADIDQIEEWLARLHLNRKNIALGLPYEKKKAFWSDNEEAFEAVCQETIELMAANYLLITYIQGTGPILELPNVDDSENDLMTCCKAVFERIQNKTQPRDPGEFETSVLGWQESE